jgi:hypothetical protein
MAFGHERDTARAARRTRVVLGVLLGVIAGLALFWRRD